MKLCGVILKGKDFGSFRGDGKTMEKFLVLVSRPLWSGIMLMLTDQNV